MIRRSIRCVRSVEENNDHFERSGRSRRICWGRSTSAGPLYYTLLLFRTDKPPLENNKIENMVFLENWRLSRCRVIFLFYYSGKLLYCFPSYSPKTSVVVPGVKIHTENIYYSVVNADPSRLLRKTIAIHFFPISRQ